MIPVFNLEKWEGLLRAFYELSHIRITVFNSDLCELISYPLTVAPYCQVIRSCASGLEACVACDRQACVIAAKRRDTYVYRCHAGLTEAVTPLYVGDVLVGYLLFGHVFPYEDRQHGIATILRSCAHFSLDEEQLRLALQQAQPLTESYVHSASQILQAVASFAILEQMASLQCDRLGLKLDALISAHYTEDISATSLCEDLGIGKTQLYKLSHELYGCGVAERIRSLRIQKAQHLLTTSDACISDIAFACGYRDYNYFISVFTRQTGTSPNAYRRQGLAGAADKPAPDENLQ